MSPVTRMMRQGDREVDGVTPTSSSRVFRWTFAVSDIHFL